MNWARDVNVQHAYEAGQTQQQDASVSVSSRLKARAHVGIIRLFFFLRVPFIHIFPLCQSGSCHMRRPKSVGCLELAPPPHQASALADDSFSRPCKQCTMTRLHAANQLRVHESISQPLIDDTKCPFTGRGLRGSCWTRCPEPCARGPPCNWFRAWPWGARPGSWLVASSPGALLVLAQGQGFAWATTLLPCI